MPKDDKSQEPGRRNTKLATRKGTGAVFVASLIFVVWQVLMVPRLIADAGVGGAQVTATLLPLMRIAVAVTGDVAHGIHVVIWLLGTVLFASVVAGAAWRTLRA